LHYVHYVHYLIVEFIVFYQVSVEFSIEDRVWKFIRANITDSVDSLGSQFRPLFRAGWLSYINKTYGASQPRQAQSVGQEPWVVED
jgi:hypothetical protein